jgi:hypothetical protein
LEGIATVALNNVLEFLNGLEAHFGIADIGDESGYISQAAIRLSKKAAPNLLANQPQSSARLFQMLARFVDRSVVNVFLSLDHSKRAFDLLVTNPAKIFAQRLIMP